MKFNPFRIGFFVFIYLNGLVTGFLLLNKFGWVGIIIAVAISYLILLGMPDLIDMFCANKDKTQRGKNDK